MFVAIDDLNRSHGENTYERSGIFKQLRQPVCDNGVVITWLHIRISIYASSTA